MWAEIADFKADLARHQGSDKSLRRKIYLLFDMPVWATAVFRFGKAVQNVNAPLLRKPLLGAYFLTYKVSEAVTGIRISSESEIGPGLMIHNYGGIIIKGKFGRNLTVVQGAQIIGGANDQGRGWPTIGDDCYIGSGAKVLGDCTLGDHVRVGANAVVMSDVPSYSVVMPPKSSTIRGFYRRKKSGDKSNPAKPTQEQ